jgi:uncharacterized membrane protein YhaH (DUF805 family)
VLSVTAIYLVVVFGFMVMFDRSSPSGPHSPPVVALAMIPVLIVCYVLMIWVSLATQVKRWHDRDKSGWWCLINLIPYIGGIWVLVECGCLRATEGANSYGPDPT